MEEKYQTALVTPLETELKQWKNTCTYAADLVDQHLKVSFAKSYKMVYGVSFSEADLESPWPSSGIVTKHLEFTRQTIQLHLFFCGNHDSCGKRELKAQSFNQCSKCKWTRYCSQPCQLDHWKTKHKTECGKLLSEADAESLFKGRRIIIGAEADAAPQPAPHDHEPATASQH